MNAAKRTEIFQRLRAANPSPTTELEYASTFQLLPWRGTTCRQAAAQVLAPGPRGTAQIHHCGAGLDEVPLLIDFFEFVRSAGTVAVFLGGFHIRVVDVLVEPGFVNLAALGLCFHADFKRLLPRRIIRAMPHIELTPAERREHRADAHHLDPVVMIGGDGLTAAVQKEVDAALNAHGLIKVRVFNDDRSAREAIYQQLCDALNAAPIQHIGKLLVLWRPQPEKTKALDEDRKPGPRDVKVLKFGRPGQRPEIKQLRVLGNQRLTPGGQIKRAKPKKKSIKKTQGD